MPLTKKKTSWPFFQLFRRKKPALIDLTSSYQYMMRFPRLPITVPPLVPTLMSYRWNDDDEFDVLPKKFTRDHQPVRRRLHKRFSDLVGPSSSNKALPPRTESLMREKPANLPLSPAHRRTSLKICHHDRSTFNQNSSRRTREKMASLSRLDTNDPPLLSHRYHQKNKRLSTHNSVDILAHRMQAAMSTELMNSLDRNFVFTEKKGSHGQMCTINRSQSLNYPSMSIHDWKKNSLSKPQSYQLIPRVNAHFEEDQKSVDVETMVSLNEPTPDYEQDEVVQRSSEDTDEEPMIDYDDTKETLTPSPTLDDLGLSTSFIIPQASITPSPEQSIPPPPPPPPPLSISTSSSIRCRTIADQINSDHKLILKDQTERKTEAEQKKKPTVHSTSTCSVASPTPSSVSNKSCYLSLSKELLTKASLRKVSHPVCRSFSSYGSMSQINERETELTTIRERTSLIEDAALDISLSSANTSMILDNDYEPKSSSKIYNDYKRRTSLISPTHSVITHPIHTHIGLRSSTSTSSIHDKSKEHYLSNKQMNVGVINQLNEHLTTRFRHQQQNELVGKSTSTVALSDRRSYDRPPPSSDPAPTNLYDEPRHETTTIVSQDRPVSPADAKCTSIPPPPPPLPVGGFRSIPIYVQRTSTITLSRERNESEFCGSNTGTSTISSKLSDTRILRELRSNPLFTKAKEHLELEPGSHGRRSGRRLVETTTQQESESYIRLNRCSKNNSSPLETFVVQEQEVNHALPPQAKRSKSMNSPMNNVVDRKTRFQMNSFIANECRQSELELVFRKRAQRSELNLT